ncbi:lamin tail domain-containing protein [Candidatus Dojkabacteria bacterium]|nr:lamin tail domain-containing protein [Candidatus Dojkabacteria bacterium]
MNKKYSFNKISLLFFIFTWILTYKLIYPNQKLYASSKTILINEVLYDPQGSDSGYEWIELLNIGTDSVDLEGWSIEVAGSEFKPQAVLPSFIIEPNEIIVIGESNVTEADIQISSLSLQNGGSTTDGVRLLDNNSVVIDTLLYDDPNTNNLVDDKSTIATSFAPDAKSGNSLVRTSSNDTDNCNHDFLETSILTPGYKNLIIPEARIETTVPTYINQQITIDGNMSSDPDGQIIKWIWTINTDNSTQNFYEPTINVKLYQEQEVEIVLKVIDNDNLSSQTSTTIEIIEDPDNPIIQTISDIKDLDLKSDVTIQGQITTPTASIYKDEIYIQDNTGGIRIKTNDLKFEYKHNYIVKGFLDTKSGEARINAQETIPKGQEIQIESVKIDLPSDMSQYIGSLITIEGKINSSRGDYLYIKNDEDSNINIYFSKLLHFTKPKDAKNKSYQISGIISSYGKDENDNLKLRLMPRLQSDIVPLSSLGKTGQNLTSKIVFSVISSLFLVYINTIDSKKKFSEIWTLKPYFDKLPTKTKIITKT